MCCMIVTTSFINCVSFLEFKSLLAKSYTVLQMVCLRFNMYAKSSVALALCLKMGLLKHYIVAHICGFI